MRYGEPVDDSRVRVPRSLPTCYQTADIERLIKADETKRTHKRWIVRDSLLSSLALTTGLRGSELANLEAGIFMLILSGSKRERGGGTGLPPAAGYRREAKQLCQGKATNREDLRIDSAWYI